jgi:hypothetical protein
VTHGGKSDICPSHVMHLALQERTNFTTAHNSYLLYCRPKARLASYNNPMPNLSRQMLCLQEVRIPHKPHHLPYLCSRPHHCWLTACVSAPRPSQHGWQQRQQPRLNLVLR